MNIFFKENIAIALPYQTKDKVIITNFPDSKSPISTLKTQEESFKVTANGLIPYKSSSNILPTFFFFKSLDSNKEMAKVEFDIDKKKLIVTSTGVIYNGSSGINAFSFQLKNGTGIRASEFIKGDGNADAFKNTLNSKPFEYGDEITLGFINKDKVDLKNYPDIGNSYNLANLNTQKFIITPNGVIPILTPNKITVKSKNNEEVLSIVFTKDTQQIIVSSSGKVPDLLSSDDYFNLIIKDENDAEILKSTLKSNENASKFKADINGKSIIFGKYRLTFIYKDNTKIEISNFPNSGDVYIPNFTTNTFKVFEDHLEEISLNSQEVNFSNIAKINFDVTTKKLIASSTGSIISPNLKDISYFLLKLRDSSNNIKLHSFIKSDKKATNFVNDLNSKNFEFGDILELECFNLRKIELYNVPIEGQTTYIDKTLFNMESYKNFFTLMPQGLQDYIPKVNPPTPSLPNIIKINKVDNTNLFFITFNTLDKVLQGFSFNRFADSSNKYNYVIFKLYDSNNTLIFTSTLPSHNLPFNISTNLNLRGFDFGYILDLNYDYRAKPNITITSLNGTDYTANHFHERYKITSTGLEFIPIFLPNVITINSVNDLPVAFIEFNILNKTIKATATNNRADTSNTYDYITIKLHALIDPTLTNPSATSILVSNKPSIIFTSALNNIFFDSNYILTITCSNNALNKVTINNFQNQGQLFVINQNVQYFKITDTGLVPFNPISILKDNVIIISNFRKLALSISFDTTSKTIKAHATGQVVGRTGQLNTYYTSFMYTLKDSMGTTIKTDYVEGANQLNRDGSAIPLAEALNDTPFDYGYTLELYAPVKNYFTIYKTQLSISNLPFKPSNYWKFNDTETVVITPLGLTLKSNSPLGNMQILNNIILITGFFPILTLCQIYFNTSSKKIIATSGIVKANYNYPTPTDEYFVITLKDSLGNQKNIARFTEDEEINTFLNALNTISFDFGDRIRLTCKYINKISILNFPNLSENYILSKNSEDFIITKSGLMLDTNPTP